LKPLIILVVLFISFAFLANAQNAYQDVNHEEFNCIFSGFIIWLKYWPENGSWAVPYYHMHGSQRLPIKATTWVDWYDGDIKVGTSGDINVTYSGERFFINNPTYNATEGWIYMELEAHGKIFKDGPAVALLEKYPGRINWC
jgi:hypothetical protein